MSISGCLQWPIPGGMQRWCITEQGDMIIVARAYSTLAWSIDTTKAVTRDDPCATSHSEALVSISCVARFRRLPRWELAARGPVRHEAGPHASPRGLSGQGPRSGIALRGLLARVGCDRCEHSVDCRGRRNRCGGGLSPGSLSSCSIGAPWVVPVHRWAACANLAAPRHPVALDQNKRPSRPSTRHPASDHSPFPGLDHPMFTCSSGS